MHYFKVDAAFRTLRKRQSSVAVCVLCRSTHSPGRPTKETLQDDELHQLPLRFNKGYAKQYSSYRVLESLFGVRYQTIAPLPEMARRAIADNVYPTVAGFGPDHVIDIKKFDENYGTLVSKRLGAEYFNGKVFL